MKNKILTGCLIGLCALVNVTTCAYALPGLQLDATPGTYIGGSEQSTVTNTANFDLVALIDPSKISDIGNYQFFISIALTPMQSVAGSDFGSFLFDGNLIETSSMLYGTPPVADLIKDNGHVGQDVSSHGIFDTLYSEIGFVFPVTTVAAYDVQTGALTGGDPLRIKTFAVDLSGLNSDIGLHFDLYGYKMENDKPDWESFEVAPYSHDVTTSPPTPAPEPATMLLFGAGLAGLAGAARRKRSKE